MMSKRSLKFIIAISLMIFIVGCSSSYTDEEVDATANARYRSGQEDAIDAAARKPFLEVVGVYMVADTPTIRSKCASKGLEFPCGGVAWYDTFGNRQWSQYSPDSRCFKEAKIGYDLPESCR
jgi:hypothetical protein